MQEDLFSVVLNAPGDVLPMPEIGAFLPIFFCFRHERLVEFGRPLWHDERTIILDFKHRLDRIRPAVGREPHDFAALVPIGKDVA